MQPHNRWVMQTKHRSPWLHFEQISVYSNLFIKKIVNFVIDFLTLYQQHKQNQPLQKYIRVHEKGVNVMPFWGEGDGFHDRHTTAAAWLRQTLLGVFELLTPHLCCQSNHWKERLKICLQKTLVSLRICMFAGRCLILWLSERRHIVIEREGSEFPSRIPRWHSQSLHFC